MTDIVNAKVTQEKLPWPRYIAQYQYGADTFGHLAIENLEVASRFMESAHHARIIDTAPEPSPAMSAEVRELVEAARELMVTHPRGPHDRRLAAALKPFEEAK